MPRKKGIDYLISIRIKLKNHIFDYLRKKDISELYKLMKRYNDPNIILDSIIENVNKSNADLEYMGSEKQVSIGKLIKVLQNQESYENISLKIKGLLEPFLQKEWNRYINKIEKIC